MAGHTGGTHAHLKFGSKPEAQQRLSAMRRRFRSPRNDLIGVLSTMPGNLTSLCTQLFDQVKYTYRTPRVYLRHSLLLSGRRASNHRLATSPDFGSWSEPPPDVALSSLFVSLFFLLVRVALKLRSLHLRPLRLCRLAVFLIQPKPNFPPGAFCKLLRPLFSM